MKLEVGDKVYYQGEICVVIDNNAKTIEGDVEVLELRTRKAFTVDSYSLSATPYRTPLWVGGWDGNTRMALHAVSEVRALTLLTLNPDGATKPATANTLMVYRNADGVEMARPIAEFHAHYRVNAAKGERDCLDTIEKVEGGYQANLRVDSDKANVRVFAPTLGRLRELVQEVLR